jgi:hypothetical protein
MQFINGIFALASLWLLQKIIFRQTQNNINSIKSDVWLLFAGCSFGVMRFAVEAETYIIPLFFSLLASYFFLNFVQTKKSYNILICSLFTSVAVLFHQIHIFWGIGLFFGILRTKSLKNVLIFVLPTLIVLLVYSCVLVFYENTAFSFENLFRFIASYYFSENADTSFGLNNVIITPISFVRTFFQIHGVAAETLRLLPAFYAIAGLVALLLGFTIYFCKDLKIRRLTFRNNNFEFTHLLIFILQFAFAFYSTGNSEFMVMLPFLIPIFIDKLLIYSNKTVVFLSLLMLLWNFFFGIFPNNHFDFYNNKSLVEFIKQNPDKTFIVKEKQAVFNQFYYETGKEADNIFDLSAQKSTSNLLENTNNIIYTDIFTKKVPYNRSSFLNSQSADNLQFVRHICYFSNSMGGFWVDEAKLKN